MVDFDAAFERLNSEPPSSDLRAATFGVVSAALEEAPDELGYWEKEHFARAIAGLTQNLHDARPPHDLGLRLALVSAEKALCPPADRAEGNNPFRRREQSIDALTIDDLKDDLDRLRVDVLATSDGSRT